MALSWLVLGLYGLAAVPSSSGAAVNTQGTSKYCSIIKNGQDQDQACKPIPRDFLNQRGASATASASASASATAGGGRNADKQVLEDAFRALADLQNDYFSPQKGIWPDSIPWTSAVIQTVVSSMMTTLTKSIDSAVPDNVAAWKDKENLLSFLHEQVLSYFMGQDVEEILNEAFDDMSWVVLGWVEALNFRRLHEDLHYAKNGFMNKPLPETLESAVQQMPWHGQFWTDNFAQRAQRFWNATTKGWDTKLCHGGMTWNPRLQPYKNAITNELYIAASISMYQWFPGDFDQSGKDSRHLQAAKDGYKWITNVNMTNTQGLYVDGFHISNNPPGNVECDERDEMVYTYNQGVILTGQRGLFTVTGEPSYLSDGHTLIRNVIKATGWDLSANKPVDSPKDKLPPWKGLGRGGILEDQCDASGTCSQDSQTFKGIFMHHMSAFCRPLELMHSKRDEASIDNQAFIHARSSHAQSCREYLSWLKYNVDGAMKTRSANGHFGMWWGANLFGNLPVVRSKDGVNHFAPNVTDYRNEGTPKNAIWGNVQWLPGGGNATMGSGHGAGGDPNDRGRGRTVETQTGGLALLKAYWEISQAA